MTPQDTLKPGWKTWRFDQMAVNVNDRIDNPSDANVEHYVGLEHLDPESLKIRRWGSPSDVEATKLLFRKGDIIFGRRRAYQRKLAVADFDGICSAHAMVLRAKPEVVLREFLPFFMQSDLFMNRAMEISVGSLSPTINWKTLAAQEFALPPMEEQRGILELLVAADDVKQCIKDAVRFGWESRIAAYTKLTQDGISVKQYKNTELGLIPVHWQVLPVGSVVDINNKLRKPINHVERSKIQGQYPYYGPTGQLDSLNEYRLDGTFALIGEDGDHFLKHDVWSMTQLLSGRFNVNNHAHVVSGTEQCLTEWFFHYFRHRDVREWLTKQGAGRLKLKKADLEQIPIALPPKDEQIQLVELLDASANATDVLNIRLDSASKILRTLGNVAMGA